MGSPKLVLVIALEISSLSWLCSCSLALFISISHHIHHIYQIEESLRWIMDVHRFVDRLWRQLAVYLFHSLARPLHGSKRLPVDVGRFDGVYLLFQGTDLC